ncbi:MAG: response regulator [Rhizobacter sp.]|nr:response regulator [Rhizobacter sp.]
MHEKLPAVGLPFLQGGGEMAGLMRTLDWTTTRLGPPEQWPQSLKTVASVCLHSRFPMLIWWGRELVMLYNDAYRPILGRQKHPRALGLEGERCWPEIWPIIGPMLQAVLDTGTATWAADQLLLLERNGFAEECYFTFSYSPIHDETGGIGGVFTAVTETTERVLHERRMDTLRRLSDAVAQARESDEIYQRATAELATDSRDLSFVACCSFDGDAAALRSLAGDEERFNQLVALGSVEGEAAVAAAMKTVMTRGEPQVLNTAGLSPQGSRDLVLVQPVLTTFQARPFGCLVAGLNPQRTDDEGFRSLVALAAKYVGTAFDQAHAKDVERRRAQALAELDRAKTAFFSNVSHELRTPLTLSLGPVEDFVHRHGDDPEAEPMRMAHRNLLRLRKLVNTVLDFSRIEAGRMQTHLEATDLAAATADIASLFRSTIEAAGLAFSVDCPPLSRPVMVDRDMWEKVVANFLSNAYKYTRKGQIALDLREDGDRVLLAVTDTGVGIRPEDQRRLFERFFRADAGEGRTDDGTGIGLALVKELVQLHGGEVGVESLPGVGSRFTVSLPAKTLFAPGDAAVRPWKASVAGGLDELDHAAGGERMAVTTTAAADNTRERILVVDDNADMRDYLGRLLAMRWQVEFAVDGRAALDAIEARPPDLVLCDVMMPGLTGLELVQRLRADPRTQRLPIVILSARAGEEARVDGLGVGADDYLVKPFTARELVARVDNQLMRGKLSQVERQVTQRLTEVFQQAPVGIAVTRGPQHVFEFANAQYLQMVPGREIVGRALHESFPELVEQGLLAVFDRVYREATPFVARSYRVELANGATGVRDERFFDFVYQPLVGADGRSNGVAVVVYDVNALAQAKREAEAANRAKDEFIAMLGHELRNPLAPILTALHLLRVRHGETGAMERAVIERQVQHMVRLVDDLLDVARITRGGVPLHKTVVELAGVVAKAVETAAPLVEQKRHRLQLDVPATGLRVDADPQRLGQVVANLLTNAAKYTPPEGHIVLRAWADGGQVLLTVTDSGVGLTPDEAKDVFGLFMQGAQTLDRPQGGLGLGLAIARSLTELHGGTLEASSPGPGQGSTFRLALPAAAPAAERDGAELAVAPLAAPDGAGRHVLVVDDNQDAAESLAMLIASWGYVPVVAHDGPSALAALHAQPVDVALLDIGLPVMDGYELARNIRQQAGGGNIRLVALTGYGQPADIERSRDSGFELHLVKPVDIARLVKVFD